MIHATVTRLRLHPSTTHLIAFHNSPHDCPVRQKRFKWKTKCAWSFQTRSGTPIFTIMAMTTSHTDHVEAFGRVNCLRGNSFLFSFHCQQHSPHTVLHAIFWDASRHRLGQPGFAPSDNINEACACLQIVQEARDCDWSKVRWCWRLIRFLTYQRNCRRAHSCWPHRVIHQLFQRLFHLGHHLSHRLHHLGCHLFTF